MANAPETRRRGTLKLGELVGKILDPVAKKRGFATTDLIAAWSEIAGPHFAACSAPEKIVWPKGEAREGLPALLVLRVDGPRAIFVQHEAGQILERVNAFLGYQAIGQIRIVQGPIARRGAAALRAVPPALSREEEAKLDAVVSQVEDDALRSALGRLGRGVLAEAPATRRRRETP